MSLGHVRGSFWSISGIKGLWRIWERSVEMTIIARSEDMLKKSMSGYRVRGFRTKAGSLLALPFF